MKDFLKNTGNPKKISHIYLKLASLSFAALFFITGCRNSALPSKTQSDINVSKTVTNEDNTLSATAVHVTIPEGKNPAASEFVKDVHGSDVNITFAENKNLWDLNPGDYNISVVLEDAGKHTITVDSELTVTALPHTPPVITGVKDKEFLTIDSPTYKTGVTAKDYRGITINVAVEGTVTKGVEGVYNIKYKATDKYKQTVEKTATVTIVKLTKELVYEKADQVLNKILASGMTDQQKARKIFDYTKSTIKYSTTGPKNDEYEVAYRGMRGEPGDCYMYCVTAKVLLERAGIDTRTVTRDPVSFNGTRHLWLIIKVGGEWYHFDARPFAVSSANLFMFTDSQAEAYSQQFDKLRGFASGNSYNYFCYDKSLYPAVKN